MKRFELFGLKLFWQNDNVVLVLKGNNDDPERYLTWIKLIYNIFK